MICLLKATPLKLAFVCSSGSQRGLRSSWQTCYLGCFRKTTENGSTSVSIWTPFESLGFQMSPSASRLVLLHRQSSFSTIPSWFQVLLQRKVSTAFCLHRGFKWVVGGSVNQVRIPVTLLLLFLQTLQFLCPPFPVRLWQAWLLHPTFPLWWAALLDRVDHENMSLPRFTITSF